MLGFSCVICNGSTCGDDPVIGLALVCDRCARSIARQIGYVRPDSSEAYYFEAPALVVSGPDISSAPSPPAESSPEDSP